MKISSNTLRLLLAESDPSLAAFLHNGFGAEHYAVDLTHDGDPAKTMVQNKEHDLAILDLNLPQADTMEILRYFRGKSQRLPILILTSRNRLNSEAGFPPPTPSVTSSAKTNALAPN
jgi:two-component system, OmpR family, response regulator